MDTRTISTRNRIIAGLITVLSKKHWDKCTVSDIIEAAQVSRRTFYNHFNNKSDLLNQVEQEVLNNLSHTLDVDREILKSNQNPSTQGIEKLAYSAFNETLKYCDKNKELLAALVSHRGDINLVHDLLDLGNQEFLKRAPYLFGLTSKGLITSPLYHLFQTIYVDGIILIFNYWMKNRNNVELKTVKRLVGIVQTRSPIQLMHLLDK